MNTAEKLQELGFGLIAKQVAAKDAMNSKVHIAYNNYEFITHKEYLDFNRDLRKRTEIKDKYESTFDALILTNITNYPELPPAHVLSSLQIAKDRNCFDTFEIAKIESIKEVIDPILFGRINGCSDMFFIDQWDNDVKFEDIKQTVKSIDDLK